jgi:pimeloyl-ACP methyl ester carboxylesterase
LARARIDGGEWYYEDRGAGETVLIFHGAFSSSRELLGVIDELAQSNRVIAPDLRGWGQSEHVDIIDPHDWVASPVNLLDELGIDTFHVVGTSLGARVAARVAAEHADRVLSLAADWAILRASAAASTAIEGLVKTFDADRKAELEHLHGDDWLSVIQMYFKSRASDEFQNYLDIRQMLDRITCPIFIARGDLADQIHPLSHSFELHEKARQSALWIAPNCPGSAMRAHPDQFARLYAEYRASAPVMP